MSGNDYKHLLTLDCWELVACTMISLDYDYTPKSVAMIIDQMNYRIPRFENYSEFEKRYQQAESSINAGNLHAAKERNEENGALRKSPFEMMYNWREKTTILPSSFYHIAPQDYIDWAIDKKLALPEGLLKVFGKSESGIAIRQKKDRTHEHTTFIENLFIKLNKPRNGPFWRHLKDNQLKIDEIDKVEDGKIHWTIKDKPTTKASLFKTLSSLR